jgi:hypothetical protein
MHEVGGMRLRPYFGDTYVGIVTIAMAFGGVCAAVSALMFFFRPVCEPILRFAMMLFVHSVSRGSFVYDPATYWFWDGYVAVLGAFIPLVAAVVIIRKPAQDRRIDQELRRQSTEFSHGAPVEPE